MKLSKKLLSLRQGKIGDLSTTYFDKFKMSNKER